jgi:hypothetical protein
MSIFGIGLLILGIPLLLGYFIGEKKNRSWRNLGLIMCGFGLLLVVLG